MLYLPGTALKKCLSKNVVELNVCRFCERASVPDSQKLTLVEESTAVGLIDSLWMFVDVFNSFL